MFSVDEQSLYGQSAFDKPFQPAPPTGLNPTYWAEFLSAVACPYCGGTDCPATFVHVVLAMFDPKVDEKSLKNYGVSPAAAAAIVNNYTIALARECGPLEDRAGSAADSRGILCPHRRCDLGLPDVDGHSPIFC